MTVVFSFANGVWLAERALVYVTDVNDGEKVRMRLQRKKTAQASWSTVVDAYYTADSDGAVTIDVTDAIRAYRDTTWPFQSILIDDENSHQSYQGIVVNGLINPKNMLIPYCYLCNRFEAQIMPPLKMIRGVAASSVEMYSADGGQYWSRGSINYTPGGTAASLANGVVTIPQTATAIQYDIAGSGTDKSISLAPQLCDHRYAAVRWQSSTGQTRVNTLEVIKAKESTIDAFDLLSITNEYVEIKGREDGFSLFIDGLSAYDLWYYSDILLSSKVEVSFDGTNWVRVQVTSKSITIPDGDAFDGKLEIAVNWKRYDAVAM